MSNWKYEDLLQILQRLDQIVYLLKPKDDDLIKNGDKVNYQGKNYYYINYSEGHYNLGNKFLVAQVGVPHTMFNEIKKGWSDVI